MSAADRAIRVSTAAAVLGVAGIAAYVSYWHAFEVVRAHGETGITARLEPATIDGLVYSSSMVVLYAARHRLPVPGLARWLLALGILATLAANVAHGWSHGPVGAAVAAWPAASLVGSYELLLWLIRTAAAGAVVREPAADHGRTSGPAGHRTAAGPCRGSGSTGGSGCPGRHVAMVVRVTIAPVQSLARAGPAGQMSLARIVNTGSRPRRRPARPTVDGADAVGEDGAKDINEAAVAAYRASIDSGRPLSERKLAAMFGKTSRRWARNRMADARDISEASVAPGR